MVSGKPRERQWLMDYGWGSDLVRLARSRDGVSRRGSGELCCSVVAFCAKHGRLNDPWIRVKRQR